MALGPTACSRRRGGVKCAARECVSDRAIVGISKLWVQVFIISQKTEDKRYFCTTSKGLKSYLLKISGCRILVFSKSVGAAAPTAPTLTRDLSDDARARAVMVICGLLT